MLTRALGLLQGAGVPEPSLSFSSGRGLYVIWSHGLVARKELPVWNACQDRLHVRLRSLGADPAAKHAATVLRLAGTVNSKNGAVVRPLLEARERPYRFEHLAERWRRTRRICPRARRIGSPPTSTASRRRGWPGACANTPEAGPRRAWGRVD